MTRAAIVVEVHPAAASARGVTDIAGYLSDVQWSDSIEAPWGSASLTVLHSLRGAMSASIQGLPQVGDWIVIRLSDGAPAEWWGRVIGASSGYDVGPNAAVMTKDGRINIEHWFATLQREQILAGSGIQRSAGTIFGPLDWSGIVAAVVAGFAAGIGSSMDAMIKVLARVAMPASLGGIVATNYTAAAEQVRAKMTPDAAFKALHQIQTQAGGVNTYGTLGHAITVAHNYPSALASCGVPRGARLGAPMREVDAIPASCLPSIGTLIGKPGGSVLDFITGTYSADPMMTELFPSLEDFALTPTDAIAESVNLPGQGLKGIPVEGERNASAQQLPTSNTSPSPVGTASSRLGRNPVILYRMRPWRVMPLSEYAAQIKMPQTLDPFVFPGTTWNLARAVSIDLSDVESVDMGRTYDDFFTSVTIGLPSDPDSAARFFEEAGLPVMDLASVIQFGFRFYTITWPFFRADSSKLSGNYSTTALRASNKRVTEVQLRQQEEQAKLNGIYLAYLRSLAVFGFQVLYNADRFLSGTVNLCTFRPDVRHGEPFIFETPAGAINAYAVEVTHRFSRAVDGSLSRTTTVQFSRGLPEELEDARAVTAEGAISFQLKKASAFPTRKVLRGKIHQ